MERYLFARKKLRLFILFFYQKELLKFDFKIELWHSFITNCHSYKLMFLFRGKIVAHLVEKVFKNPFT